MTLVEEYGGPVDSLAATARGYVVAVLEKEEFERLVEAVASRVVQKLDERKSEYVTPRCS